MPWIVVTLIAAVVLWFVWDRLDYAKRKAAEQAKRKENHIHQQSCDVCLGNTIGDPPCPACGAVPKP